LEEKKKKTPKMEHQSPVRHDRNSFAKDMGFVVSVYYHDITIKKKTKLKTQDILKSPYPQSGPPIGLEEKSCFRLHTLAS